MRKKMTVILIIEIIVMLCLYLSIQLPTIKVANVEYRIIVQLLIVYAIIHLLIGSLLYYVNLRMNKLKYFFHQSKKGKLKKPWYVETMIFLRRFVSSFDDIGTMIERQKIILDNYVTINKRIKRLSKMKDEMLKISSQVLQIDNEDELFKYILRKAVDTIEEAETGSLWLLDEEGYFNLRASKGFDFQVLRKVKLRKQQTFLWSGTDGKMDRISIIRDIENYTKQNIDNDTFNNLEAANGLIIQATLTAPIHIHGKLYGMLNIDSLSKDSFDQDDVQLMNYFTKQIENTIENYLLVEEILYLSRFDQLTALYNRDYFDKFLNNLLRKSHFSQKRFSLAIFDMDNFKEINDTYGHAFGDKVLELLAVRIKNEFRQPDIIARYGGDEFVGLFFDIESEKLKERIEALMTSFKENPLRVKDNSVTLTFSYGIATFSREATDAKTLFNIADKRMYEYKKRNK